MRLPIGGPYQALLISEQSLGADQGQKFVYVVDGANQVSYRLVQVGRAYGRLRVVAEGLKPTEKIVVSGLQRVRPGAEVAPQVVPMPGSEVRDQKSEVRDQKSEVRDQKSEVRDQKSAVRDQKSAVRDQKSAVRDQKSEVGSGNGKTTSPP
jgi:multidrug efflux system membrane fusion protein